MDCWKDSWHGVVLFMFDLEKSGSSSCIIVVLVGLCINWSSCRLVQYTAGAGSRFSGRDGRL